MDRITVTPPIKPGGKPLGALYVNHISYQVNDYKKVRDFYMGLLRMKISEDDGIQCRLVFGNNMGDVYQATDTKMGRSVAIEFLPDAFSHDIERVARFQNKPGVLALWA